MSINMSNVKAITLGGQNVKKIEDSNGNVLWSLPTANAAVLTFNSYIVQLRTSTPRYFMISQLTEKISASTNIEDAIKFFILTSQEIQNIQNQTYSQDTVLGHTLSEWQNSPDSYFLCYVLNNEVYMIGNSQNSTANDTVLGTTNDLTYAKHYYPFDYTGGYKYVNLTNNSSTSTSVTRWRHSGSYYWINHTNSVGSQNTFTFLESSSTTSPYIYYGKEALTNLAISGYTTTIPLNETFSFGGTAVATYTDGSTKDVTNSCTFSGYDMSTAGTYTVTVSYTEDGVTRTKTYSLKVSAPTTATVTITVGASQDITTTQYYNRIVVPSLNSIKSAVATKTSISVSDILSIDQVELVVSNYPSLIQPKMVRKGYTTASGYKTRYFLMSSNSTSSTVIIRGNFAYSFSGSSSSANTAVAGFAQQSSYDYDYVDITSYLYTSSTRSLYGAYAEGNTSAQYDAQTPSAMFVTDTSPTGSHYFCKYYSPKTLTDFSLRITYTYRE